MAYVSLSVVVSRSGADLDLNNGTTHDIVQWNKPDLDYRRVEVTGRYQAGSRLVAAVPDVAILTGVFRCKGDTWADVDTAVAEAYAALQQFSYTVTVTLAGVVETFTRCQPATIRPTTTRSLSAEVASGFADFEFEIRCVPNVA